MGIFVFLLAIGVAALQVFHYYPSLPETMAVHFGAGGAPNGWMTRDGFVAFYFALLIFETGIFTGLGAFLPKISARLINIPNKDYWLAPERREETFRDLSRGMYTLTAIIAGFIIAMHQMLIEINIKGDPVLDERGFLAGLGLFLAVIACFIIWTYWRFRKPEKTF